MSTAHATAAKTSAAPKAAPPVMRAPAPQGRAMAPPLASLAAIPAGPAIQRQCDACESEDKEPGLQRRLNAAASAASVQRKCAACEQEEQEESGVQPRLEVGPVGDRYEMEADSIAAQVMAMPAPDVAATAADESVQRACSACSASKEELRARRDGGDESIAASDGQLTHGGSALPSATRRFFEERMGRDLGDVRVHSGSDAAAKNDSISARAFTYKNHVWLGSGESALPTFTMAHELAHVMQQTAPGPVGPAPQRVQRTYYYEEVGKSLPDTHNEVVNLLMQRDASIFAEVPVPNYNARGFAKTKRGFGRADLISFKGSDHMVPIGMSTAPCPTAQQPNWYCGASADRSAFRKPTTLDPSREKLMHKSGEWSPTKMEAEAIPRFGTVPGASPIKGFLRDAGGQEKAAKPLVPNPSDSVPAEAKTVLAIGDVKAGAFPGARRKAVSQITHYMLGFENTRHHYEDIRSSVEQRRSEMVSAGKNDLSALPPALTPWSLKAGLLTDIADTKQIAKLRAGTAKIKLRRWTSDGAGEISKSEAVEGASEVDGNLFLWREVDSSMAGAWSYLWTPVSSEASSLHTALGADADFSAYSKDAFCLRDALSMPVDAKGKPAAVASKAPACLKPLRLSSAPPRVRRKGGAKPAPKAPERVDQFADNFKLWSEKQKKIEKNYSAYQKTPQGKSRAAATAELEARQNIVDAIPQTAGGIRKDKVLSAKGEQAVKDNAAAQFWIEMMGGSSGRLLGQMRLRFGKLFLAIFNGYQKTKIKVVEFLNKLKAAKSGGGRIVRAGMKIVAKVLAGVANHVLPRVGDAIATCIEEGVHKKIDSMFEDGPLLAVRERIDEAQLFGTELTDAAVARLKDFGGDLFGNLQGTIEKVRDGAALVGKIVGYAKEAFDIVRLAICAAGGIESAGLACVVSLADKLLSFIDLSPLELLADRILGSCYGQTLLAKAMYGIDAVQSLPLTIATTVIEKLKDLLPAPVAELLCDPDKMAKDVKLPDISEVTCGRGNSDWMPGPGADGSYRKGDWVPPPGYPSPAIRKQLDKFEKEACAADPSKPGCTATPPADPKKPEPAPPPPEKAPPPVIEIPDLVPPAVGKQPGTGEQPAQQDKSKGGADGQGGPKIKLVTKPISGLDPKAKPAGVFFFVHPTPAQGGWAPGNYNLTSNNRLTLISEDKNYGPTDPVSITIHKVYPADPPNSGKHKIDFTINQGIRVTDEISGNWLEAAAGLRNEYTQVGAPK
jgi:hypothetical protein